MDYLAKQMDKKKKLAIGLMSGTSMDGIDAALVELEGQGENTNVTLVAFETFSFTEDERSKIKSLCDPVTSSVDQICRMNVYLGHKFAEASLKITALAKYCPKDVDFISSHGQTIYHMPEFHATLQIGELAVIAEETGCLTVGDFRPSDMAVGGQGAPLVPFTDYLLFHSKEKDRVLLNIGGMSNITILPKAGGAKSVYGFDTGPGNVLIDEIVKIETNNRFSFDKNGDIAMSGSIHHSILNDLIAKDPFIRLPPPKSTGREQYTEQMAREIWDIANSQGISFSDIIATVTQYTVEAVISNLEQYVFPKNSISEVIVSGGGVYNAAIIKGLAAYEKYKILKMEDIGYSSDAKEAISFAILGNECLHGNCNNLPNVTGAQRQTIMGKIVIPSLLKDR
ncbi:anhydro-N-acetylmuramic acid kinase [Bacillus sp. FJAT-49705]|uniref:Anhydro-N-acetylmuramic acid kinase n=1 Tax=Cytobacillus citreus TaxID=2833586 RepID=A0ABS5NX96_9BACI|nr:anhydro-N-acetylmuramic acid kinase [Cytobacillus citreus]